MIPAWVRQGGPGEGPGALATETGGMGTDAWGFWLGNIFIYIYIISLLW